MTQLVNQTLSQSAPATVILAVKSVTKIFAGEIIERARKIQDQWLAAAEASLPSPPADSFTDAGSGSTHAEKEKEQRRGPLTPDHLREALRRYKREREGGCVGLLGLGQNPGAGLERFAVRNGGRRLLR